MKKFKNFTEEDDYFKSFCISTLKGHFTRRGDIQTKDLFVVAGVNRAMEISDGFRDLLEKRNVSVLPVLLRLQVDTLSVLSYLLREDRTGEIVSRFMNGVELRHIVLPGTRDKITDKRMIQAAKNFYPWIDSVYERTSSWVHFSPTQVASHFTIDESRVMAFGIPRRIDLDLETPVDELCDAMTACLQAIRDLVKESTDKD